MSQKLNNEANIGCHFIHRLHMWYQCTTSQGAYNDQADSDLRQGQGQIS